MGDITFVWVCLKKGLLAARRGVKEHSMRAVGVCVVAVPVSVVQEELKAHIAEWAVIQESTHRG